MKVRAFATAAALAAACWTVGSRALAQSEIDEDYDPGLDDDEDAPPAKPPLVALGLNAGGIYQPETRLFNRSTSAAGLGTLPVASVLVEPWLSLQIGRVILPIRMRYSSSSSDQSALSLESLGGMVGAGYLLLKDSPFVLYPSLSFGLMRTTLTAGQAAAPADAVTFAALAKAGGPTELSRLTVIGEAAFDAQYRIVGSAGAAGLYIGAHAGFTAGLADTSWSLDQSGNRTSIAPSGPHAPVSGLGLGASLALRL